MKDRTGQWYLRGFRKTNRRASAFLLTALLVVVAFSANLGGPPPPRSPSSGPAKRMTFSWYLNREQWRADIRTLANVLQYLSDSPKVPPTNGLAPKASDA